MSTLQIPERPVFNSLDPSLEPELAPPISPLAVTSLVLGVFSLTAALSVNLAYFAIVVAVLSAALIWRLSRDSTVGGTRLAQIGLCCAVLGSVWGLTTTRLTEAYIYSQAAEHAKLFLQTLSSGKQFEAFELTQPESNRQVTGTDIEAHYIGLMQTNFPSRPDMLNMSTPQDMPSSETMKNSHAKEELDEFLSTPGTKEIKSHGKDAQWEFVRGDSVVRMSSSQNRISVVMVDRANPAKKIQVELNRITGQYMAQPGKSAVALWDVDGSKVVKE